MEAITDMTNEIPKQTWKDFFDEMSRERHGWQTKFEVLKDDIGAQMLSEGLPLMGVMFEEKTNDESAIEIMLGEESGAAHQTHAIFNPTKVAFLENDRTAGGTLEIEDASGEKTLLEISQPVSVGLTYTEVGIIATSN